MYESWEAMGTMTKLMADGNKTTIFFSRKLIAFC
jgi:hypothetical protein